jgi:hypothetical protein
MDALLGNLWRKPHKSACILSIRGCGKSNFAIQHLNGLNMQIEKLTATNFLRNRYQQLLISLNSLISMPRCTYSVSDSFLPMPRLRELVTKPRLDALSIAAQALRSIGASRSIRYFAGLNSVVGDSEFRSGIHAAARIQSPKPAAVRLSAILGFKPSHFQKNL